MFWLGRLIESGTHDQLMNMGAHYSKLVSRQLDSQEKIVEREKIIEKKIIIEKEKFVGSSSQHPYDSL